MKKTERRTKSPTTRESGRLPGATAVNHSSKTSTPEYLKIGEIKELIELISEKKFNEFELECGEFYLRVQNSPNATAPDVLRHPVLAAHAVAESLTAPSAQNAVLPAPVPAPEPTPPVENLHVITSPIVGTFYRSPSPTSEPFVRLGAEIEAGQALCIIEAMKLMNEITSDVNGSISKIYVENGQPVEYGQPLFGIQV